MVLLMLLVLPITGTAFAQVNITVSPSTPCFLNYTAGFHMFENCNARQDWLKFLLQPFEWVTGGYFSLIIASILVLMTYLKYHKAVYPVIIGIIFIPTAIYLYPSTWISVAIIFVFVVAGVMIYKALVKQTKEY